MYIPHTSPPVQPRPVSPDFASSFFVLRFFLSFCFFFFFSFLSAFLNVGVAMMAG